MRVWTTVWAVMARTAWEKKKEVNRSIQICANKYIALRSLASPCTALHIEKYWWTSCAESGHGEQIWSLFHCGCHPVLVDFGAHDEPVFAAISRERRAYHSRGEIWLTLLLVPDRFFVVALFMKIGTEPSASWAETTLWAAGTMWLLPGVQQLRALRMSHRLTCFTSLLALAVGFWFGVFFVCGCLFPPFVVFGFASAKDSY